eukprot:augustus_masked-scaffold_1-processed-gene-0.3-mRNA-1 protein AED:1.00 eAED:1.00 QI:0/-1/0/0/-1/1/1/0/270
MPPTLHNLVTSIVNEPEFTITTFKEELENKLRDDNAEDYYGDEGAPDVDVVMNQVFDQSFCRDLTKEQLNVVLLGVISISIEKSIYIRSKHSQSVILVWLAHLVGRISSCDSYTTVRTNLHKFICSLTTVLGTTEDARLAAGAVAKTATGSSTVTHQLQDAAAPDATIENEATEELHPMLFIQTVGEYLHEPVAPAVPGHLGEYINELDGFGYSATASHTHIPFWEFLENRTRPTKKLDGGLARGEFGTEAIFDIMLEILISVKDAEGIV